MLITARMLEQGELDKDIRHAQFAADVKMIPDEAFKGHRNLQKVTFGDGLQEIGFGAFQDCASLAGPLEFPTSLQSVKANAFYGCTSLLGELVLPASLRKIGPCAFRGCSALEGTLTIPRGVAEIGYYAFHSCSGITQLIVGPGVGTIGFGVFEHCTSVARAQLDSDVADSMMKDCWALQVVVVGEGVQAIGPEAFHSCCNLESVQLPGTLQTIGYDVFNGCDSLPLPIDLPRGMRIVGDYGIGGEEL